MLFFNSPDLDRHPESLKCPHALLLELRNYNFDLMAMPSNVSNKIILFSTEQLVCLDWFTE